MGKINSEFRISINGELMRGYRAMQPELSVRTMIELSRKGIPRKIGGAGRQIPFSFVSKDSFPACAGILPPAPRNRFGPASGGKTNRRVPWSSE